MHKGKLFFKFQTEKIDMFKAVFGMKYQIFSIDYQS